MLLSKLKDEIKRHNLLRQGERVLVGVSGGTDSLALLDALHRLSGEHGWAVFAAHFNHQFRGEEAEEDARFVQQFCLERGVPLKLGEADVPRLIKEKKMNPQEAAREARFSFFRQVAKEWGIAKVALAHHANDQAETVLMRIFRGTGMEGLAGIPLIRRENQLKIIRPLLSFYKQELEEYCHKRDINPRLDSSNLKTYYRRNFLRLEVIPWLEQTINPSVQQSLIQLSEIAFVENDFLDEISRDALKEIMKWKQENKIIIKGKLFLTFHAALQRRMIKLIFNYLMDKRENIGFLHIDQVCDWIREGRSSSVLELPHGMHAIKEYDSIIFTTSPPIGKKDQNSYKYRIEVPGRTYINEIDSWVTARFAKEKVPENNETGHWAFFDYDAVEGDLEIRTRQPGDRMTLLGMEGSKKVKDILIDSKIPRGIRETLPIIADGQQILWIPGVKRSNRALIHNDTKRILTIHIHQPSVGILGGSYEE